LKRLILLTLLGSALLLAWGINCPVHSYAPCYNTGQISPGGGTAYKWHCTCGDDIWVRR
jgi:hypothetical protein